MGSLSLGILFPWLRKAAVKWDGWSTKGALFGGAMVTLGVEEGEPGAVGGGGGRAWRRERLFINQRDLRGPQQTCGDPGAGCRGAAQLTLPERLP